MGSAAQQGLCWIALATLLLPQAAAARDVALCSDLTRRLNSMPQIIGSSSSTGSESRHYTTELSRLNAEIRALRIDMRRNGCGGGSIVSLGHQDNGQCPDMQDTLRALEDEREALAQERNNARRLLQPSEERVALLAAIRQNDCSATQIGVSAPNNAAPDIRIQGIALPKEDSEPTLPRPQEQPGSSITHLGAGLGSTPSSAAATTSAAASPPAPVFAPERPYDPSNKVRTVGPVFFPENEIDLANPKSTGPQPQQ